MRQYFCYLLSTPEQLWEENISVKDQAAALREIKKRPRLTCQAVRQEVHIRCPQGSIFTSLSFSAQILHSWNVEPISQYSSYCSWEKDSTNHKENRTEICKDFTIILHARYIYQAPKKIKFKLSNNFHLSIQRKAGFKIHWMAQKHQCWENIL